MGRCPRSLRNRLAKRSRSNAELITAMSVRLFTARKGLPVCHLANSARSVSVHPCWRTALSLDSSVGVMQAWKNAPK